MYTFKVLEENENKLESIIEMSGVTTKFTVQQIIDHLAFTEKTLKETEAQLEVHKKQDEMAVEALPILKELPEDKMTLVMMYASRQVQRPESENLATECKKTIETYKERLAQIKEATGISNEVEAVETKAEEANG